MVDNNVERVAADVLSPAGLDDGLAGSSGEPYDVPRGTCPLCASVDVIHLAIGMPAGPADWGSGPEWLHWVGCVHPGYNRRCTACEGTWSERTEVGPTLPDLPSLLQHAEVDTLDELADWISEDYELDAWIDLDGDTLVVVFHQSGVGFNFPLGIDHFWDTLDVLHEEVSEELEDADDEE